MALSRPRAQAMHLEAALIVRHRLRAQRIAGSRLREPEAVVAWMGAMQAQDFTAAKWGIGLRAPGLTEAEIDQAFDAGRVLRTHILRPTWHFVAPADIRWMLSVSGPRVHAANLHYYERTGADSKLLSRSRRLIERSLEGGKVLTRAELATAFAKGGVRAQGQLLAYLMMHAELDGVVCSGPRRGKQFTYMLLEERVPSGRTLGPDEALGELARRYFSSHGPATVRDFSWWSGMTIRETKRALDIIKAPIVGESVSGQKYWCCGAHDAAPPSRSAGAVDLLPIYDEYLIAYKERQAIASVAPPAPSRGYDPYAHFLMVDGRLAGTWRRSDTQETVHAAITPHRSLTKGQKRGLAAAVDRLGAFVGRRATVAVD
jgi:hypothetical protein